MVWLVTFIFKKCLTLVLQKLWLSSEGEEKIAIEAGIRIETEGQPDIIVSLAYPI